MLKRLSKLIPLFLLGTFFTGCGFQPLMTGQNDTPQRFTLKINGSGYAAYKLRRELEKQLALTPKLNDKSYVLTVSVAEGYTPTTYGTDATVSRSQVQSTATYILKDCNRFMAQGTVTAHSSYLLNYAEEFSTRSAQTAASERTFIILAEELAREVMLKIRSAPEKQETTRKETAVEKEQRW